MFFHQLKIFIFTILFILTTSFTTNNYISSNNMSVFLNSIQTNDIYDLFYKRFQKNTNESPILSIYHEEIYKKSRRLFYDLSYQYVLRYVSIELIPTNKIYYLFQWKEMFSYYLLYPNLMEEEYFAFQITTSQFINSLLTNYNIEDVKTKYVKDFLLLSLAKTMMEMKKYILDKYPYDENHIKELVHEIKSVEEICFLMDQENIDYHTDYNDFALKMLVEVANYYISQKNIYYPYFKVWKEDYYLDQFSSDIFTIEKEKLLLKNIKTNE